MSRLRGVLATGASLAGFAIILVAHTLSGSSIPAALRGSPGHKSNGPAPKSSPSASVPTIAGPAGVRGNHTVTGKVAGYGYGEIAVKLQVDNGRIVSVRVAKLATADSYSQQIAAQVVPMLTREVMAAQSARISAISGATYTSEGYAYSVQSALDTLKKG